LQAFSQFGAVYGGTYMLNKPECKVEFDEKGKVCGVISEGENLSARKNKCDLDNIRTVSVEDGKNLAEKQRLFFMETSALDSTNVKTAFEMVIKEIYNNAYIQELECSRN
nr:Ras-related protein RABA5c-like [Tanacetum cinerariifolium]